MTTALVDGIRTHYRVEGSGPPLLMMAPRGFNAVIGAWDIGVWKEFGGIGTLARHFTVIAYDRRESGATGGRIEPLGWPVFARHAKALLEHLRIERAWLLGPCMSVAVALQFAAMYPAAVSGMILPMPVGGARWQRRGQAFFDRHIEYVSRRGLAAIRARSRGENFFEDPESGPWSPLIGNDAAFADAFVRQDAAAYLEIVRASRDALFPDSFVCGPRAEVLETLDIPASIWPGDDTSHSTSSAHQLRELLPRMEYWDIHPSKWTPESMLARILDFRRRVESGTFAPSPKLAGPPMPPVRD